MNEKKNLWSRIVARKNYFYSYTHTMNEWMNRMTMAKYACHTFIHSFLAGTVFFQLIEWVFFFLCTSFLLFSIILINLINNCNGRRQLWQQRQRRHTDTLSVSEKSLSIAIVHTHKPHHHHHHYWFLFIRNSLNVFFWDPHIWWLAKRNYH